MLSGNTESANIIDDRLEEGGEVYGSHPRAAGRAYDAAQNANGNAHELPSAPDYPEVNGQTRAQKAATIGTVVLAAFTSNYSLPLLAQPFGEMLDNAALWPYLEFTALLGYLFNTHHTEIVGRMRAEFRDDARWGAVILPGKVLLATTLPLLAGLLTGMLQWHFEEEIKKSQALVILTSPPVSRMIAALVGLPLYMLGWKIINSLHPVKPYRYSPQAPLHPLQVVCDIGYRAFYSVTAYKFLCSVYRPFGPPALLHNKMITAGVGVIDQSLYFVDVLMVGKNLPHPIARTATQPLIPRDENNAGINVVDRYAHARVLVFNGNQPVNNSRAGQKVLWNSAKAIFAIGLVFLLNHLLSKAQEDKETLLEPYYTLYILALAVMSNLAGIFFQTGGIWAINQTIAIAPRVRDEIAGALRSCYGSFFSRSNAPAQPAAIANETTPLAPASPPMRPSFSINQDDKT